jgi:NADH-quinone oxidoreductase subunit J
MMNDWLVHIIFYVLAAIAALSALMVISQNNPVRCVLFLVVTFFASAGIWLIAGAEFLSLILILVYVGAVMTLFLFVVMMLNIDVESMKSHYIRHLPFGLILVALLTGLLMVAAPQGTFKQIPSKSLSQVITQSELLTDTTFVESKQVGISNTEALGMVLYTDYILCFELAAVILLVAIVSCITLVHRNVVRSKKQCVTKQIMTQSKDRIRLVSLTEK